MNKHDIIRPTYGPLSGDITFRWSVGFCRRRRRSILAWFQYREDAEEYLLRCRKDRPDTMFDILQSLY